MREAASQSNYLVVATDVTTTNYIVTSLVIGTTYEFTIEAMNADGYSDPSASLILLHALAPDVPTNPTSTNEDTGIVLSWTPPADNGDPITSYTVKIKGKQTQNRRLRSKGRQLSAVDDTFY